MGSYTIRRGDTLSQLAARFHTSVSKLAQLNGIRNVNLIYAGAKLRLPGSSDTFEPGPKGPGGTGNTGGKPPPGGIRGSEKLAAASRAVEAAMGGSGLCAKGVSTAVQKAFGFYPGGNGNDMDSTITRTGKFKQIHISLEQALKIPGLVLTWETSRSAAGKKYGHTAITQGDGHTSTSDFRENYTTNAGRTGFKVFMYVG